MLFDTFKRILTFCKSTKSTVLQEHKINRYWNVDGERPLSGSLLGFTKLPPDGHVWEE